MKKDYKKCKTHDSSYASTYNVETLNSFNPEKQIKILNLQLKMKLQDLLNELRGFKFEIKKKKNEDETKYSTFNSNSKAKTVIHDAGIDNIFESIYSTIMTKT